MKSAVAPAEIVGAIPAIAHNSDGLYEGNLAAYTRALGQAKNVLKPYHGIRHMLHVLYLVNDAARFYHDSEAMTLRDSRNLHVGAIFHDFDHLGMAGNDDINIMLAKRAFDRYIQPEDIAYAAEIKEVIGVTEFPHKGDTSDMPLTHQIIRDADLSQAFSVAWIQNVIFGLAAEMGTSPVEVLKMQEGFLGNLTYHTEWARQKFPQELIQAKIAEANELLELFS